MAYLTTAGKRNFPKEYSPRPGQTESRPAKIRSQVRRREWKGRGRHSAIQEPFGGLRDGPSFRGFWASRSDDRTEKRKPAWSLKIQHFFSADRGSRSTRFCLLIYAIAGHLQRISACISVSAVSEKSFNRDPKGSASTEGDRILSVHALAAGSRLNEKRTNRIGNAQRISAAGVRTLRSHMRISLCRKNGMLS